MIVEILAEPANVFCLMASVALAYQFFEDLKKGEVDCRKNWILTGAVFALAMATKTTWQIVGLLVIVLLLKKWLLKMVSDGDIEILQWLFPGMFLFGGASYAIWYALLFLLMLSVWSVALYFQNRLGEKTQGTIFLAIPFVLVSFLKYYIGI